MSERFHVRGNYVAACAVLVMLAVAVGVAAARRDPSTRIAVRAAQGDTISGTDHGGPLDIRQATRAVSGSNLLITVQTFRPYADQTATFTSLLDTNGDGLADYELTMGWDGLAETGTIAADTPREVRVTVARPDTSTITATLPLSLIGGSSTFDWTVTSTYAPDSGAASTDAVPANPSVIRPRGFVRVAGPDRIGTSVAASFFGDGDASAAVLARADQFPDALSGVPLAAAVNGPLLLTPSSALDPNVGAELARVLPKGRTVYLLGGTAALSSAVEQAVTAAGYTVVRLAGADRFATATAVASQGLGDARTIFLARGDDFADALAAGPAAATRNGAILLTLGSALPAGTAAYLQGHPRATVIAVGGSAAAADPNAQPIVGTDRYATAAQIASTFFPELTGVGLASGLAFPDGLSGGAAMARLDNPILLTDPATLSPPTQQYLASAHSSLGGGVGVGYAFGGASAIADSVVASANAALG